ncbi:MAG: hypothetical protein U0X87_00840 [Anaerolineales bacterium]
MTTPNSRFKLDVTSALASEATAVLLDPEVSAAQAIAQNVIPNHVGLVVAVEATGYTGDASARRAQIIPDGAWKKPNAWAHPPSNCSSITIPIHRLPARSKTSQRRSPKNVSSTTLPSCSNRFRIRSMKVKNFPPKKKDMLLSKPPGN